MKTTKLDIFEYKNYRDFLRDFYESNKKSAEKISFRHFARLAGFSSPSFLKMVIEGKRNLSQESIRKFSLALKFNKDEEQFFTNLVLLNQATSVDEKRYHSEQLLRSRHYKKLNPLKSAQYDYYTHWYFIVIRELVATSEFKEDPEWISKALTPSISTQEAKNALETLLELGLIKRDQSGKLVQAERALTTGDEVDSVSIVQFHREMIRKGSESIERFDSESRDISSLSFATDEETARQIKALVQKFRKELISVLTNPQKEATNVYQLNFQLFPLTKVGGSGKKE